MKKIILILLVLVTVNVYAQKQPQTLGGKKTVVVVQSDLKVDSLFILPVRDTNFTPAEPSMVYRPQDKTVYVHNGIKWNGLNIFNIVDSVYSRSDSIFFTKNGNEHLVSKNIKSITWPSGFNATNAGGNITLTTTINGLIAGDGSGLSAAIINSPLTFSSGALGIRKASATDSGYLSADDWAAFNSKLSSSRQINTINSITGGGDLTQNRSIQLVNDLLNPGPLKIYSTDASGIKGWFNIPLTAPAVTSAFGRIGDIVADSGDYGSFYAPLNHTHVSSHITNFTQAVRNLFTGGAGINVNNETGVISWPGTGVITSLNGLNASTQTFTATGDLSINSFGTAHTFSVPYRIDSIKKSNDSVYALKGGEWWFQYIDSAGGGGGTPAGGTNQIQYNSAGAFAASSNFTINNTTKTLTIGDNFISPTKQLIKGNGTDVPTSTEYWRYISGNLVGRGQVGLLGGNANGSEFNTTVNFIYDSTGFAGTHIQPDTTKHSIWTFLGNANDTYGGFGVQWSKKGHINMDLSNKAIFKVQVLPHSVTGEAVAYGSRVHAQEFRTQNESGSLEGVMKTTTMGSSNGFSFNGGSTTLAQMANNPSSNYNLFNWYKQGGATGFGDLQLYMINGSYTPSGLFKPNSATYYLRSDFTNGYNIGAEASPINLFSGGIQATDIGVTVNLDKTVEFPNGNVKLAASKYLNWGSTFGTLGYGIRDNAGTMQFKNSGGAWTDFGSSGSGNLSGTLTSGRIPVANGANSLTDYSNLTFASNTLTVGGVINSSRNRIGDQDGFPTAAFELNKSGAGSQAYVISNAANSSAGVYVGNSTLSHSLRFEYYNTSLGAGNLQTAGESSLFTVGTGFNVGTFSASPLKFYTDNTQRANFNSSGRLFVGGSTSATAQLHLAAGTATANTAPLKLTPSGAALLTTPEAGAIEVLADSIYYTGSSGARMRLLTTSIKDTLSRAWTIENPSATENKTLWFTKKAITLIQANDVLTGSSTPSVTWNIKYASARDSGSPTSVFSSDRTTTSTSGASTTTFANATIPAGSWIWLTTSANAGTVTDLNITLTYTQ